MELTNRIPPRLAQALRPITLVVGHYGVGKTNFSVNLAIDLVAAGNQVTLVDLDIVNPYFRASEQRRLLEEHGVELIAPVFAEVGTSLDVPSLTGKITPALELAKPGRYVIVDVGGDDAGSVAVGRYARTIAQTDYAMLGVLNRFRNLVQEPADAVENLREIEAACRLRATALVSNAHLKASTDVQTIGQGAEHAQQVATACELPIVAITVPVHLAGLEGSSIDTFVENDAIYPVKMYVRTPWE